MKKDLGEFVFYCLMFCAGFIFGQLIVTLVLANNEKDVIQCIKDGSCKPYTPPVEDVMQASINKMPHFHSCDVVVEETLDQQLDLKLP